MANNTPPSVISRKKYCEFAVLRLREIGAELAAFFAKEKIPSGEAFFAWQLKRIQLEAMAGSIMLGVALRGLLHEHYLHMEQHCLKYKELSMAEKMGSRALFFVHIRWYLKNFYPDFFVPDAAPWTEEESDKFMEDFWAGRKTKPPQKTKVQREMDNTCDQSRSVMTCRLFAEIVEGEAGGDRTGPALQAIERNFAPNEIANELHCGSDTLATYAKEAGVNGPKVGRRDFRYPAEDRHKILRYVQRDGKSQDIRDAAKKALEIDPHNRN